MKKILLFFSIFLTVNIFAQSIHIEPLESSVSSSDIWLEMDTYIKVKNISNNTLDIKVSKEIIDVTPNSTNYFCWVNCFLPGTMISPTQITFAPGDSNEIDFHVFLGPNGDLGQNKIKYCAFDANDTSMLDSACTIITFNSVTASLENLHPQTFSDFHPNPASSNTEIHYNLNEDTKSELVVYDLLGNLIRNYSLAPHSKKLSLNLSELNSGMYFVNIKLNDEIHEIKRLIVSH